MEVPVFFTVEEVSKILKVSKVKVYKLLNNKDIRPSFVGRSYRVQATELERYSKAIQEKGKGV